MTFTITLYGIIERAVLLFSLYMALLFLADGILSVTEHDSKIIKLQRFGCAAASILSALVPVLALIKGRKILDDSTSPLPAAIMFCIYLLGTIFLILISLKIHIQIRALGAVKKKRTLNLIQLLKKQFSKPEPAPWDKDISAYMRPIIRKRTRITLPDRLCKFRLLIKNVQIKYICILLIVTVLRILYCI